MWFAVEISYQSNNISFHTVNTRLANNPVYPSLLHTLKSPRKKRSNCLTIDIKRFYLPSKT